MLKFFGDTNSDLFYEKLEGTEINMINMPYILNDELKMADLGKDKNYVELFDALKQGVSASTCGLNKQDYIEYFEPHLSNGDDIIYVTFSHNMSNTFEYMRQAIDELKEKYPERSIDYVNTNKISVPEALVLWYAYLEYKKGKTAQEIIEFVEKFKDEVDLVFVVDDLHHLKRGGRISGATEFFGTLLGIKPVLTISDEGKIVSMDKIKGRKKVPDYLLNYIKENGENVADYPIIIAQSNEEEYAKMIEAKIREFVGPDADIWIWPIGPTIGVHAGPGTMGLAFHCKKK